MKIYNYYRFCRCWSFFVIPTIYIARLQTNMERSIELSICWLFWSVEFKKYFNNYGNN